MSRPASDVSGQGGFNSSWKEFANRFTGLFQDNFPGGNFCVIACDLEQIDACWQAFPFKTKLTSCELF